MNLSVQQYFVWDTAFQSTKRQDMLEIWEGMAPLATPMLSMVENVKCTVEQRSQTFYEIHIAYRLALIYSTCSSSLQFEPGP